MINCIITSPIETSNYDELQSIVIPTSSGQMQVLENHAETFVLLKKGNITLQKNNKEEKRIQVNEGSCHIKDNLITIFI